MKCLNADADCKYQLKVQMLDSSEMDYEITVIWLDGHFKNAKLILFTSFFRKCFNNLRMFDHFWTTANFKPSFKQPKRSSCLHRQIAFFQHDMRFCNFPSSRLPHWPSLKSSAAHQFLCSFNASFQYFVSINSKGWNTNARSAGFGVQTTRSEREHFLRTLHAAKRWPKELADQ